MTSTEQPEGHVGARATPHIEVPSSQLDAVQTRYNNDWMALWRAWHEKKPMPVQPDRHFDDPAWHDDQVYQASIAVYQTNARAMRAMADAAQGDPETTARLRFMVDQWIAAMSPANLLASNPQAQQRIIASQGESLRQGIENLWVDLQRGQVTQSDPAAFELGVNLATTSGAVIFETELFQLIHYAPTQPSVFATPLLIVPPCINKFYILDLTPRNSLVKFALDEGHQVFMMSWRNPDPSLVDKTWDDYVESILLARDVVGTVASDSPPRSGKTKASRASRATADGDADASSGNVNALGFCIGGALLACAANVDVARRRDSGKQPTGSKSASKSASKFASKFTSLTLLTTMLDYSDTGVLDVFIDEAQVGMHERTIGGQGAAPGLMKAADFANTFSLLRPRDLFWNYVVDNYLLGTTPPAFDLLFWNGDSTHLPGPMFCWYLRRMYLENKLKAPEALEVAGVPMDLSTLRMPCYVYGSRDDHIVPWHSAYASLRLLGGPVRFVLGASGHIAGVINPPASNKRHYWRAPGKTEGTARENDAESGTVSGDSRVTDPQAWLNAARQIPGSWWPDWSGWLAQRAGGEHARRPAPVELGHQDYPVIEAAPGRYVKQRSDLRVSEKSGRQAL